MKIGIFVSYDSYFKPVADITMPVLARYCERHGYTMSVTQNPLVERTLVWDRCLTMMENCLKGYDWILHMDADVLITNQTVSLESIIEQFPKQHHVVMSKDFNNLNDGIVFTRGTMIAQMLWKKWWKMKEEVSSLAATFKHVENEPKQFLLGWAPQKIFNSYDYSEYGLEFPQGDWEQGDFILHLPGMTTEKRVLNFSAKLDKIVW